MLYIRQFLWISWFIERTLVSEILEIIGEWTYDRLFCVYIYVGRIANGVALRVWCMCDCVWVSFTWHPGIITLHSHTPWYLYVYVSIYWLGPWEWNRQIGIAVVKLSVAKRNNINIVTQLRCGDIFMYSLLFEISAMKITKFFFIS